VSEVSNQFLNEIFTRIPLLADFRAEDFQIDPLPGYTNRNFQISNRHGDWVLRIPKDETNRYIDRQAEASNIAIAHRLGLAPKPVWCDASGLSLSATLRHTRAVTSEELQQEPMQLRLAGMLNKLHRSNSAFKGTVDLGALLTRYYRLMPESAQAHWNKAYHGAKEILKDLALCDDMLVPSHNDLVLENLLLDESGRLWVIDWEYSSMASPYWDLATLCNAANLDHEQTLSLLRACQDASVEHSMELLIDYRSVLQVLSDCWMAAFT
jgi:thiamine kinase-like enzyme